MKVKKILPVILATLIISSNLMGCEKSNNITSTTETPYYTLNIDGEKQYYTDDYQDVIDISSLVSEYINLAINLDYTSDNSLDKFELYSEVDSDSDYYERYLQQLHEYELIEIVENYELTEIEFYNIYEIPYATVTANTLSTLTHATEEYLGFYDGQINEQYQTDITVKLTKENDTWIICDVLSFKNII